MKRITLPLTLLLAVSAAFAEPVPFAELQMSASVETEMGTYGLWSWAERERFPVVVEFSGMKESFEKPGRTSWQSPGGAATAIDVSGEAMVFLTNGRADQNPRYRWAPMLLFRPKQPGVFKVKGAITFQTSNEKEGDSNVVRWAVVRLIDQNFTLITGGWAKRGDVLDLASLPALAEVTLAADEQLGFTAWRGVWHWNASARTRDLEFIRVK